MNAGIFELIAINFVCIGLLPVIFFRRGGRLNPMWWATAAPFLLCLGAVTLSFAGLIPTLCSATTTLSNVLSLLAVPVSVASIALISFTLGTHRIPIALWHQTDDAPRHIVTWGAYERIRHPFYTAFLLAFVAACLYSPQAWTAGTLLYGIFVLNLTAAREEKRLCASQFGEEYKSYMQHTGRFLPRRGRKAT